jgi:DNA-binding transcriptional MerR regulator
MSVHALRYYERAQLLATEVPRNRSGHRSYSADDVEWLEVCMQLRRSGMSLESLREYTRLVRAGAGNEEERLALLQRQQQLARVKMAELQSSLDLITYKVDFYQQRVAEGTAASTWAH